MFYNVADGIPGFRKMHTKLIELHKINDKIWFSCGKAGITVSAHDVLRRISQVPPVAGEALPCIVTFV